MLSRPSRFAGAALVAVVVLTGCGSGSLPSAPDVATGGRLGLAECGDAFCPIFDTLKADLADPGYIPLRFQGSLLARAALAERLLPIDPIHPTDPHRTAAVLRSIVHEVEGLARAGHVGAAGLLAIRTDVDVLLEIILPPNPI